MRELIAQRLAAHNAQIAAKGKGWRQPSMDDFAPGQIFSLDQTLTKTGLVRMEVIGQRLLVHSHFTIKPQTDRDSFWGSYDKAEGLLERLVSELRIWPNVRGIACEMPAVGGMRNESSLLAGYVAHRAAKIAGKKITMVSMLHARNVLGGPTCKTKYDLKLVLAQILPASRSRPWNEDERDALGLGLAHLYDLNQESSE
jgi:hypothetical protein